MQYVKKPDSKISNSPACTAIEYPLKSPDINCAIVELTGRYPETGVAMNTECKELAYVVNGSGRVIVDNKETALAEGDMVLIDPGEKFYWDGTMTLVVPCAPAWRIEQHKIINDTQSI